MTTLELILSIACVLLAILAVAAALRAGGLETDHLAALAGKNEYWGKLQHAENELAHSGALAKSLAESARKNAIEARENAAAVKRLMVEAEERQRDAAALVVERRQLTRQCADFAERIRQLEAAGKALAELIADEIPERFTTSSGNVIACRETAALAGWEELFKADEGAGI